MKKLILKILILFLPATGFSQSIENVDYNLIDDVINIYYDINEGSSFDKYEIKVTFVSDKEDVIIPRTLSGDVGIVKGDGSKKIEWSVFEDRQELSGTYKVIVKIAKVLQRKHTILYSVNQPDVSFLGIKYAYIGKRFGGYIHQLHGTDPEEFGPAAWVLGPIIRANSLINTYAGVGKNPFMGKNSFIEAGTLITPKKTRFAFDLGLGLFTHEEDVYSGFFTTRPSDFSIYLKLGVGIHF